MAINITLNSEDYDALWKEMPEARDRIMRIALSRMVTELKAENEQLRAVINGLTDEGEE